MPDRASATGAAFAFGPSAAHHVFLHSRVSPARCAQLTPAIFPMLWTYLGAALILMVIARLAFGLVVARAGGAGERAAAGARVCAVRGEPGAAARTAPPAGGDAAVVERIPEICRPPQGAGVRQRLFLFPVAARHQAAAGVQARPVPHLPAAESARRRAARALLQPERPAACRLLPGDHQRAGTDAAGGFVGGLSSSYFHDRIKEGDIVDVRAPAGNFFLETTDADRSCSSAAASVSRRSTACSPRSSTSAAGARSGCSTGCATGRNHDLQAGPRDPRARQSPHQPAHLLFRWSESDEHGEDYHVQGRVSVELLRRTLPSNNFRFYYCGPGPMMEALSAGLKGLGRPRKPPALRGVRRLERPAAQSPARGGRTRASRRSDGHVPEKRRHQHLGRHARLAVESRGAGGHRHRVGVAGRGNCGTCVVALHAGEVGYVHAPGVPLEARTCLTCLAHPKGDVTLDA